LAIFIGALVVLGVVAGAFLSYSEASAFGKASTERSYQVDVLASLPDRSICLFG